MDWRYKMKQKKMFKQRLVFVIKFRDIRKVIPW